MTPIFQYGISQEDGLTECQAVKLEDGDRLLCISSAGEIPLNLLTFKNIQITAVDSELNQILLSKLKLTAATRLESEKAGSFLGFMPMEPEERIKIFSALQENLSTEEIHFWNQNRHAIARGVVNAGRFEQYIARFRFLAQLIIGRKNLLGLLECQTIDQQEDFFDINLDSRRIKALLKLIFHPRIYQKRGIDQQGLINEGEVNMSSFFYQRLRNFCTANPCRLNLYYQFTFFGKVLYPEALPEYLQPPGQKFLSERIHQIEFLNLTINEALEQSPQNFYNKFHLSNIGDWMRASEFDKTLALIHAKANPQSRILYRYIHIHHPIPENLDTYFKNDPELIDRLTYNDRFPFYSLVPIRYERQSNKKAIPINLSV